MSTIATASGATIAVSHKMPTHLHNDEVFLIHEREERVRRFRRSLPKRKTPDYMKPGPITIIQMSR